MKLFKFERIFVLIICSFYLFFTGCEYKGPEAVWVEDEQGASKPVITSIEPADSAVAGDILITLHGENFSEVPAENIVTFANVDNFYQVIDSSKGEILEIIQAEVRNASSNSITLYRPKILGDSCMIQVAVRYAYQFERYGSPYRITTVSSIYVKLLPRLEAINAMEVDNQENLYIYMGNNKTIDKVTPDGERVYFCTPNKAGITTMRMGPGGNLYLSRLKNVEMYTVASDGTLNTLKFPQAISYFDFDENGNIFAGGKESNLIIRNPDGIFKTVGDYEKFEIFGIRIFNGYVYVIAEYRGDLTTVPHMAIWKSAITSDNGEVPVNVGEKELVIDWSQSGDFSDSEIKDMTFSALEAGGDLFVATNNGNVDIGEGETDSSTDPILIVHQDGSFEPLYKGGLLLPDDGEPDASKMVWGSGENMYVYNSNTNMVIQLGMKREGAAYYGRGL